VAMLSSGISLRRLLVPYFIASAFIALISFVFNGWVIPHSNRDRLAFEMQYFQNKFYFESRNVHMQTAPGVYLFIQNYNNQTNTGYQFSLERFKDNRLIEKLTADNIQWDSTKHKWTLRFCKRKMVDEMFETKSYIDSLNAAKNTVINSGDDLKKSNDPSTELTPSKNKPTNSSITFQNPQSQIETIDTTLTITPKDFENNAHEYDGMTIPELGRQIEQLKFRGTTGVEAYETERHIRFAAPCTTFVLVFMGVIVSARKSRGGTGFQIALGFLLAFVFILFFTMTRTFAETGSLTPVLAAWLPNSIFTVISLAMYKYVPR
jgi:lipopolysaccharide export system permease protein